MRKVIEFDNNEELKAAYHDEKQLANEKEGSLRIMSLRRKANCKDGLRFLLVYETEDAE